MTLDEIHAEMESNAAKSDRLHRAKDKASPVIRTAINKLIDRLNARQEELEKMLRDNSER